MIVLGIIMPEESFGSEKVLQGFIPGKSHDHRVESRWSYEGFRGPRLWGFLEDAYQDCRIGHQQSPIDFAMPQDLDHQENLNFQYADGPSEVIERGQS